MKFAKIVFWVAGIYGVLVVTPLYFIFNDIGVKDPPPITHPGFYYGFVGVALAWQFAFFIIGTNPARFRPLMVPSIFEKWSYGAGMAILYLNGRIHPADLGIAALDSLLGVLFLIAFFRARPQTA